MPLPDCTNCYRLRLLCRRLYVLHAHVYFPCSTEDDKAKASKFRAEVQGRFAGTVGVKISDIFPDAVAPHPMPQFEIAFTKYCLQDIAPWLMFSRPDDYSILVHPFTSDVVSHCWHMDCVMQVVRLPTEQSAHSSWHDASAVR